MAFPLFRHDPVLGHRELDNFFSNVFNPAIQGSIKAAMSDSAVIPRHINLDVTETDKQYLINADLPGCTKDEVSVDVNENLLSISAQKETVKEEGKLSDATTDASPADEKEDKKSEFPKYHRVERTSNFSGRTLRLPENVDMASLKAKMNNGVLNITIDKMAPPEIETKRKVTIE